MASNDFDPFQPVFSQADAVSITQADNDTIDNWVRYKHVMPLRAGKRRLFSFNDLLVIDLMHMLQKMFRAEIHVSRHIATSAAKSYLADVEGDRAAIGSGQNWAALIGGRGDAQIGLVRDSDGTLREHRPDDSPIDSVDIILPVRLIARRILAGVREWEVLHGSEPQPVPQDDMEDRVSRS
jgi:hypothetical protein